jgi:hypothetical protein
MLDSFRQDISNVTGGVVVGALMCLQCIPNRNKKVENHIIENNIRLYKKSRKIVIVTHVKTI